MRLFCLHGELRITKSFSPWFAGKDALVKVLHEFAGFSVRDLPKANDERLGASQHKRSAQAKYTFTRTDFAEASIARRKNNQFCVEQVHACYVFGRKQPVLGLRGQPPVAEPSVAPRQSQSGAQHG